MWGLIYEGFRIIEGVGRWYKTNLDAIMVIWGDIRKHGDFQGHLRMIKMACGLLGACSRDKGPSSANGYAAHNL